jgi:hypothetical protein
VKILFADMEISVIREISFEVKVRVTLRLAFYRQSIRLGAMTKFFFFFSLL